MNMLDRTLEGVTDGRSLRPSLQRLLLNVAAQIRVLASNPEALSSYADMLQREADNCGRHVLANTPIIEATPALHPEPEHPNESGNDVDLATGEIVHVGDPEDIDDFAKAHPELVESRREVNDEGVVTAYFASRKPD